MWAPDGRELFYRKNRTMMVVSIATEPTFRAGPPDELFDLTPYRLAGGDRARPWDIHPDGDRFLMIREAPPADDTPKGPDFVVVQNWTDELQRLVPTP